MSNEPTDGVTGPVKVNPAGIRSTTVKFVACAGPLLVTFIVYVTVSPWPAVTGVTVFTKTISASLLTVISTDKSSPTVVSSVWSPVAAVVVFVIISSLVPLVGVAGIVKTAELPSAISPISHIPVPKSYVFIVPPVKVGVP